MNRQQTLTRHFISLILTATLVVLALTDAQANNRLSGASAAPLGEESLDQVLEWNQIFIDTLVSTNTANSSSQRLGAIVHTAIFDAYNGVERRYTPIFVNESAPPGASRRSAVIAAAYTALVGLFPSRQSQLYDSYLASLAALSDDEGDGGKSRERGIEWGTHVGVLVLAWRLTDGFNIVPPAFTGGTAIGQWRPTPRLTAPTTTCGPMSAQSLAFTSMFVLESNTQFRPGPPRALTTMDYTQDYNTVRVMGRRTGSGRTDDQTALAPFWEGNASVHWNQAANQIARANGLSLSQNSRLFAVLNLAMADTAFTVWSAKRYYGSVATDVTWRPWTAIVEAGLDGNPDTDPDSEWQPLVNTPCHPEYPAGHPSLNAVAATVLLNYFDDQQMFTLATPSLPDRTYFSITQAREDGNNARVWGGMHYPSTVAISDTLGASIANYVNDNSMLRIKGDGPVN